MRQATYLIALCWFLANDNRVLFINTNVLLGYAVFTENQQNAIRQLTRNMCEQYVFQCVRKCVNNMFFNVYIVCQIDHYFLSFVIKLKF